MAARRSEAFERLYLDERLGVFRTAFLITGDREEAMELTQETFARAFQHWRKVSRYDRPAAWLQQVVANLAVSSWRQRRRRFRMQATELHADDHIPPVEPSEPAILAAVRSLAPAQRAVVVLRFYADLSVADVAHALGKRPGTVKALTSQALGRLRPVLEARGVRP